MQFKWYPGLGLRVERIWPKVESSVGTRRVHEGKARGRELNRVNGDRTARARILGAY
jgi:hypothetical protein